MIWVILLVLFSISFVYGCIRMYLASVSFEIINLSYGYYNIGVHYNRVYEDEDVCYDELLIGLFLINIAFVFVGDSDG